MTDDEIRKTWDDRGQGWQGTDAIERDKQVMRDWHELMKANPNFVKLFTQGKIQIIHSLTYEGTYSHKRGGGHKPFTRWVKQYGRRSRDQISCIAANAPIGANPKWTKWDYGNANQIYGRGFGFLLKGYPAFVAEYDVMTQTLTATPQSLKDFHKNSGQVKRSDDIDAAIDPDDWLGADEVILDNWEIIGVYIAKNLFEDTIGEILLKDARELNVPVYKMNYTGILTKIN